MIPRPPLYLGVPAAWTVLIAAGCIDIPRAGVADVVVARWDPSTSTLPTPTDLVRDEEAGRLSLPIEPGMPAAEVELREFLNRLDGYPISTPVSLPLSGEIDSETLAGNLELLDLESGASVPLTVELGSGLVKAWPSEPDGVTVAPGRTYAYALRGYDTGAAGSDGELLIADAPFSFLRSEAPLTEHATALPGASKQERAESARDLEAVRVAFEPLFERFEALGLGRGEVAVLGSFTTSAEPAIWFDPLAGRIPFPNDLLINPDTGNVELPIAADDDADYRALKEGLSAYDGFSTTASLRVQCTGTFDLEDALDPDVVRVFRIDDGSFGEVHDLIRRSSPDGTEIWVAPKVALEHSARYAYVVTSDARDEHGRPVQAQVFGHFLRSAAPLSVDGVSQVGSLDDAQAARVEPLRAEVAPLLDALGSEGIDREDVAAVVPFTTLSAPDVLLDARARLYAEKTPVTLTNVDRRSPLQRGMLLALPAVETIVTATMVTRDTLDPISGKARPNGEAVSSSVELVLTIPRDVSPDMPLPVVIFGHGLYTSRELVYLVADRLAQEGYAAISIDLPYHGARSTCGEDFECRAGQTCGETGQCVHDDGSPGALRSVENPFPEIPFFDVNLLPDVSYPLTTGKYLIDTHDLFATGDHFRQALIDLMQLVRVVRGADWAAATGGLRLDGDDIMYLGMSLGGILGSALAGVEPLVDNVVLNVPGAGLVELLTNSAFFSFTLRKLLNDKNIEEGSEAYFRFLDAARWAIDPADPINLAHHATVDPLWYTDPETGERVRAPRKRVLIQMADGDLVVPNVATHLLADRMQLPISDYFDVGNHGFLFDPIPAAAAQARDELVEFYATRGEVGPDVR